MPNKKAKETATLRELRINENQEGQRIDNYLINQIKGAPRSLIYRLLRTGQVRVNKGRKKPTYRLQSGDLVRIPPGIQQLSPVPQCTPPDSVLRKIRDAIIYDDKGLLVINKPAGIAVHGGSGLSFGVIEIFRTIYPQAPYLELVHRLDRETSGCLMIAKKRSVLRALHQLLREEQVEKQYLALVKGRWDTPRTVSVPLRKNVLRSGERIVSVQSSGKASVTVFRPIKSVDQATVVEAYPKTGRTHQIRVHAAHIGCPIAGDEKYGDTAFNQLAREHGLRRLFLHATSVEFELPNGHAPIRVNAPLGDDLHEVIERLSTIGDDD